MSSDQTTRYATSFSASTVALHAGRPRGQGQALVSGIAQSTTFHQEQVGEKVDYAYSRVSNPSVTELEVALGELEEALPAVTFSTGLAAETALFFALLEAGDHVVVGQAVYGGTIRLVQQLLSKLGITHTFVDSTDTLQVARAITKSTKLVFIESPANPLLVLTDIAAVAKVCKAAGVPLAVDNTFLTPVLQRPLDLGADITVYSTTKHIEGHSSALGGAIVSRDEKFIERLKFIRKSTGGIQTPFNAWLTAKGLRTLPLRLKHQSNNALVVARWLKSHEGVATVNYPGLESFPQRELARKQHIGNYHGGVISFELRGGVPAAKVFLRSLQLCSLVEHIGGIETLITHPATMTHGDVPKAQREAFGISDGLVRISVGIEDTSEIIGDLERAIDAAIAETDGVEEREAVAV
ncbi:MAG: PLP-dependent aspartate aminotransferase family protein [Phycisphaerales bacterium]|nr:PLP-dependent aspartate aminotransferase family protein [Phycisphaerales bacterium]